MIVIAALAGVFIGVIGHNSHDNQSIATVNQTPNQTNNTSTNNNLQTNPTNNTSGKGAYIKCPYCTGLGYQVDPQNRSKHYTCPNCGGTGLIWNPDATPSS